MEVKQLKKINLKENSRKALIINILLIIAIALIMLIAFFYIYLPVTTHHGETITVPDLEGMHVNELEDFLDSKDLRYVVDDSSYNPKYPALVVLSQDPAKNARVKINRRIHITINSPTAPLERVPDIIDSSVKQADQMLESSGFKKGTIKYVPDLATNAVLSVYADGKKITKEQLRSGFMLPKGSRIDLEVGDGLGKNDFPIPNLVGKPVDEAEMLIRGAGLTPVIAYDKAPDREIGTVLRQKPAYDPNKTIKVGDMITIWVSGYFPEDTKEGTDEDDKGNR